MKFYEIMESGGPVMWPLLACSLIVLTVVIERFLFWYGLRKKRNRKVMDEILALAEKGSWNEIKKIAAGTEDHVIRVLVVGILHRRFDMGRAMEAEAEMLLQRMNRYMPILDTMITVAPLLGILGTVLGIISSFKMLGSAGISDPKLVTSGIAQALITTATGLIISVIAVIPYNFFNSRINHAIYVVEKYATSLEVVHQRLNGQKEKKA